MVTCLLLSGCGAVPVTGRRQILLVSDQEIFQAGLVQYKEYLSSAAISSDPTSSLLKEGLDAVFSCAPELVRPAMPESASDCR